MTGINVALIFTALLIIGMQREHSDMTGINVALIFTVLLIIALYFAGY